MPSQIEMLKEKIPRLEAKHGPDNPYVKGLKQQLVGLERQADRQAEREAFHLATQSMRSPPPEELALSDVYESALTRSAQAMDEPSQDPAQSSESTTQSNPDQPSPDTSTAKG